MSHRYATPKSLLVVSLFTMLLAACGGGRHSQLPGDQPGATPAPESPNQPIACSVPEGAIVPGQDRRQTWAPVWVTGIAPLDGPGFQDQTIRNVVTTHWPGSAIRVRLSNRFGEEALMISSAWIGRQADGAALQAGSNRQLRFGGKTSVRLAPGAQVVSDVVDFPVAAFEPLAISLFIPGATGVPTGHDFAQATSYISETGDFAAAEDDSAYTQTTARWHFVEGVDALAERRRNIVIAYGDSITEGLNSTTDGNQRYPDVLQRRITAELPEEQQMIVLNKGISGNRVLSDGAIPGQGKNAIARINWDVMAQVGVTDVVFMEGINDLGLSPNRSAAEVIAGITQVAQRIRAAGINLIGSTLMPATTFVIPSYGALPEQEAKRQAINEYIRSSGVFDYLVDWDQVTEDPKNPGVLNPAFDSGDGLHPNDAGYAAMANAIDLAWLRGRTATPAAPGTTAEVWRASMMPTQQAALNNQTLRMIVHTHGAGSDPRIRLSNRYGETEITLGPVTLARVASGAELVPESLQAVTFNNGDATITVPPGADVISDAVAGFEISQFEDLAVNIHVPAAAAPITGHLEALQESFIATGGDFTADATGTAFVTTTTSWLLLQGLEVTTPAPVKTVVALGNSITDGSGSSINANARWPDVLQRQLAATPGCEHVVVLNAGIGGNQLLDDQRAVLFSDSAQRRMANDVLDTRNLRQVILNIGTNDLGISMASADAVIDGLRLVKNRIHAEGLALLVTPQTPASNPAQVAHGSPEAVAARQQINCWTRENAGDFDGFADFAGAIADPDDPDRMAAEFDSGDGLHPNDAGYRALAGAIDLAQICQ